jgi:putative heme-binding domain-containing protein
MAHPPLPSRSPALWFTFAGGALLGLMLLASCTSVPSPRAETAAAPAAPVAALPAGPVAWGGPREYEVEELTPIINRALKAGGRDFARGRKVFEDLNCALCHHFGEGAGGIGPDISGVGGRMGTDGILREIIEPSAYISDLFGTKTVTTTNGDTFTGRMLANNAENVILVPYFTVDPTTMATTWDGVPPIRIKAADVADLEDSGISPMPPGLINSLKEDQVADLLAFLISGGDPANKLFKPAAAVPPAVPAAN